MATFVFLNLPLYGHVNPTLAVAQELVQRGQQVFYYLTEEFRASVQATGATFRPYESKINNSAPAIGYNFSISVLGSMLEEEVNYVLPQVIDRVRTDRPDVIVYDFLCAWGREVVEELRIPAVSTRGTYASNNHFNLSEQVAKSMGSNVAPSPFFDKMRQWQSVPNIVFIPRFFQPAGETFDEQYLFVGPPILPRYQTIAFPFDKLESERPLLYISLGSIVTNQLAFYQSCFEAFGEQPWQVVLSIGKETDLAQLGSVPKNFLLSSYVPQLEILPRTQVFVTHAGTISVMESLYFGVPMVLIPQQFEQQWHARRTVDLGAGLLLDKNEVTATTLHEAVERIAKDASYREHAQQLQQATRAAGGQQRAAAALIQFAETQQLETARLQP